MNKFIAGVAWATFLIATQAQATSLNGNSTTDNAFYAFISTDNSVLGTLIASGNDWTNPVSINSLLTPGVTNYLQIQAINYGGWGGVVGSFTLSDSQFQFANGSQSLITDTTNWLGSYNNANSNPNLLQPWVQPTGAVVSYGPLASFPWGTYGPSLNPPIDSSAQWIWPADANTDESYGSCQYCTVDLSTAIFPTATPLPSTWLMLLSGFVGLGFFAYRGTKKRTAAIATA